MSRIHQFIRSGRRASTQNFSFRKHFLHPAGFSPTHPSQGPSLSRFNQLKGNYPGHQLNVEVGIVHPQFRCTKCFLNGTNRLRAAHFTPTLSPWFHSETPTSLRFKLSYIPWLARLPLSIIPHLLCNIRSFSTAETTRGNRFRFPLS